MQTNRRPALQSVCLSGLFLFVASVALTQTSGWGRFAAGLGAYAVLIGLAWTSGLQWDDMGLSRKRALSGLVLGLRVSMVVAAGLLAALLIAPEVFQDERYRQGVWHAVLFALFVVPLQTVLFEELLFRGVVWGLVRKAKGARVATHVSSALFGLWHIAPSLAIDAAAISVGGIGVN